MPARFMVAVLKNISWQERPHTMIGFGLAVGLADRWRGPMLVVALVTGLPLNGAMASAINMLDDVHGGAGEQAVELGIVDELGGFQDAVDDPSGSGYWVAEASCGRGVATAAVDKLVRIGFDEYLEERARALAAGFTLARHPRRGQVRRVRRDRHRQPGEDRHPFNAALDELAVAIAEHARKRGIDPDQMSISAEGSVNGK